METFKYVNRVNLSVIFGLCLALNSFPLVEAREVGQYGGNVTLGSNPTTTYRYIKDQNIPTQGNPGRNIQVRDGVKFQGKLIGNGPDLSQTVEGKVTIEGLKGETKLKGAAKFSKKGAAKGLSRGLKFGKLGGPYGLVITTGLGLALDKLIEESGQDAPDSYFIDSQTGEIYAKYGGDGDPNSIFNKPAMVNRCDDFEGGEYEIKKIKQAIWDVENKPKYGTELCAGPAYQYREHPAYNYRDEYNQFVVIGWYAPSGGTCYTDKGMDKFNKFLSGGSPGYKTKLVDFVPNCIHFYRDSRTVLVDDSIIDLVDSIDLDALFDKWGVKDYEQIFPYIDEDPILELEVPDPIIHDIETSVFTGSDGEQYHVENISKTDFSPDGSGGFSSNTMEVENIYKDGQLVSSQVSNSVGDVTGQGSSSSSGSGSSESPSPPPAPEIPTDCDLFPSQCRHNEWVETPMQEPPPNSSGDFSDLGVNVTLDDVQGVDVNFGEASCPAPIVVDLIIFEPVEITFYFMCEHAKSAKPFILISASLFALYIILGSNRGKA